MSYFSPQLNLHVLEVPNNARESDVRDSKISFLGSFLSWVFTRFPVRLMIEKRDFVDFRKKNCLFDVLNVLCSWSCFL